MQMTMIGREKTGEGGGLKSDADHEEVWTLNEWFKSTVCNGRKNDFRLLLSNSHVMTDWTRSTAMAVMQVYLYSSVSSVSHDKCDNEDTAGICTKFEETMGSSV
jgi:hypothetical protein